ncbi:hypothetical protein F9L16_02510 [Agarivorans sp. B2Z047]|uniref:hypothetical protein n=1 Tax=Agarivorans sp. B2Z047 TaxID=2652721 RepID=UPI00128B5795|nr:hypothetical protein [Agarivorans sp. B2Z047]MPW27866.1 hypothetical protein [Agarivorans sp. B2Z047]UQN44299.1 hypothetical protein LQZ07_07450 [Agarivorans sp. B2Z047]
MSIKKVLTISLCVFFSIPTLIGIGSSIEVEYVQAGNSHPFRSLVGEECNLRKSWYVYGWASFDNTKEIGSYQLREIDSTSSRYILSKEKLATNTQITVKDVYLSDSLFMNEVRLHLAVENYPHTVHLNIGNIKEFCRSHMELLVSESN